MTLQVAAGSNPVGIGEQQQAGCEVGAGCWLSGRRGGREEWWRERENFLKKDMMNFL